MKTLVRGPKYRIKYSHVTDGDGEVTILGGHPITDIVKATTKMQDMGVKGEGCYTSLKIQIQQRPGARWEDMP